MNLKEMVKAYGWTMETLAHKMGVSQPAVSKILNGNPTLSNLKKLSAAMGISLSELVANEEKSSVISCPHCGKPITIKIE